jgi:hypothetical protein
VLPELVYFFFVNRVSNVRGQRGGDLAGLQRHRNPVGSDDGWTCFHLDV